VTVSCARVTKVSGRDDVDVLIIAPHPDDEVLLAAGVLDRALREGRRAAVIVVTNGDFTCERSGPRREAETVAALQSLGLAEDDIHFLGYPDGFLAALGPHPLPPIPRLDADGSCRMVGTTSATRGAHRRDEHSARVGSPAPFSADALSEDLAALLARLRPHDVYLPHPIDEHPDHSATYAFFRRALEKLKSVPATVHRGVVHAGPCWPGDCSAPFAPLGVVPPLPAPLSGYLPAERLPVDPMFKYGLISRYPSQTGPTPTSDWLAAFAKQEERFYPEQLTQAPGWGWVRRAVNGMTASTVDVSLAPTAPLTAWRGEKQEQLELTLTAKAIVLERIDGANRERLASWSHPEGDFSQLRLRVDPRPDDGDVSEWSLWGPDGFVGEAVISPAHQRISTGP
jgi:LmbE family N-acetylglucosaminyl deacetylase